MEDAKMKAIFEFPLGTPRFNATTSDNLDVMAQSIKNVPGVGQPIIFFTAAVYASIGFVPSNVDLASAPLVTADVAANKAMIEAQLANPLLHLILA